MTPSENAVPRDPASPTALADAVAAAVRRLFDPLDLDAEAAALAAPRDLLAACRDRLVRLGEAARRAEAAGR
ncbi:MAG TPA: hypothetical protein VEI02_13185 [Planctomycetota bacterium]|nr:hypothetical protein [Planctomycetota bacterium]